MLRLKDLCNTSYRWLAAAIAIAVVLALLAFWKGSGAGAANPWQPLPPPQEVSTMTPEKAYSLYLAWRDHVGRVPGYATGIKLKPDGSFSAIHGAADFNYSFENKTLRVMRVLGRGSVELYEETDPGVVVKRRLAALEPWSMGAGQFYLDPHPWISEVERAQWPEMNTLTLMRAFNDDAIDPKRFVTDVRWLVFWGEYWWPRVAPLKGLKQDGSERAFRSPEEQAATRPALEQWAREILSHPEPPDARTPF